MKEQIFKTTLHHSPNPTVKESWLYINSVSHYRHEADEIPFYRNSAQGYQMFYTISGSGWVDYNGNMQTISPGTITCVDLANRHGFGASKGHIWEHYWIICEGKGFPDLYEMIFKDSNVHKVSNPQLVHQLIKELFHSKKNNYLYIDVKASACIMQIADDLLFYRTIANLNSGNSQIKSIETAVSYIENNFNQDTTVASLAEAAGYSTFHFSRIFKNHTGFSPGNFIIKIRIEKAKNLLLKTSFPIELIAEKTGFHTPNYFNKIFREREGITPGQYRKMANF